MSVHYFIYSDKKEPYTGGRMPHPNNAYVRHYGNLMELQRLCSMSEGLYKWQAEKELRICQDKLAWWEKRPGFDWAVVRPQCEKLKKLWENSK